MRRYEASLVKASYPRLSSISLADDALNVLERDDHATIHADKTLTYYSLNRSKHHSNRIL